jgi:hypothetical protein
MNTSQLRCCIACDPLLKRHAFGVFPADRLPGRVSAFPSGFIANTDIHSANGRHFAKWLDEHALHVRSLHDAAFSCVLDTCGKPIFDTVVYNEVVNEYVMCIDGAPTIHLVYRAVVSGIEQYKANKITLLK